MQYQIALPPELGIDAEDFVAAWNTEPQTSAAGQAQLDSAPPASLLSRSDWQAAHSTI